MKSRYHLLLLALLTLLFFSIYWLSADFRYLVFRSTKIDSIGHIISFFLLTWVVHNILKLPLISTIISLSFYAALTELGQWYLGFRNAEFTDFFADLVGIMFFVILRWSFLAYKTRNH